MTYEEFIGRFQAKTGIDDRVSAERIIGAVLAALVEYLPADMDRPLVVRLPREIGAHLGLWAPAEDGALDRPRLDTETFVARIAERTGADVNDAMVYAVAVLDAVRQTGSTTGNLRTVNIVDLPGCSHPCSAI